MLRRASKKIQAEVSLGRLSGRRRSSTLKISDVNDMQRAASAFASEDGNPDPGRRGERDARRRVEKKRRDEMDAAIAKKFEKHQGDDGDEEDNDAPDKKKDRRRKKDHRRKKKNRKEKN